MVSEPACCPFCVQENFGIIYTPPPWRAGIGSEGWVSPFFCVYPTFDDPSRCSFLPPIFLFRHYFQAPPTWPESPKGSQRSFDSSKVRPGKQKRFKSLDHTDPDVVTVGMHYVFQLISTCHFSSCLQSRSNSSRLGDQVGCCPSCRRTPRKPTYNYATNRGPPRSCRHHEWENSPTWCRSRQYGRRWWRFWFSTLKTTAAATAGTQQLSW
jgi:hypothetical protein